MGNKLLLADDSITIQKVVGIIFANEDYELTVVDNGTAALEKARVICPDVILVDALMPGKTGYEVCAEVRQDAVLKGTPILLLTGAFEPFDEEKAKQCGADDFISKPFESQQLIDRVKNLVALGKTRGAVPPVKEMPVTVTPPSVASSESIWNELPELPVAAEPFMEFSLEPATADVEEAFSQQEEIPTAVVSDDVFSLTDVAVAGTIDDDLWGAFEVEEVSVGQPYDFANDSVSTEFEVQEPGDGFDVEESFTFAEDENTDVLAAETEILSEQFQEFETGWEPVGEQTFSLESASASNDFSAIAEEKIIDTVAKTSVTGISTPADKLQFAAEDEYVSVQPEVSSTVVTPVAAVVKTDGLTQDQLTEAISKISREIIEKIVWEVVPDLAEVMIREEIRKIKAGTPS